MGLGPLNLSRLGGVCSGPESHQPLKAHYPTYLLGLLLRKGTMGQCPHCPQSKALPWNRKQPWMVWWHPQRGVCPPPGSGVRTGWGNLSPGEGRLELLSHWPIWEVFVKHLPYAMPGCWDMTTKQSPALKEPPIYWGTHAGKEAVSFVCDEGYHLALRRDTQQCLGRAGKPPWRRCCRPHPRRVERSSPGKGSG